MVLGILLFTMKENEFGGGYQEDLVGRLIGIQKRNYIRFKYLFTGGTRAKTAGELKVQAELANDLRERKTRMTS